MKKILIMRHAKSDWADSGISDFQRPLNKRGEKEAPLMGEEIKKRHLCPDLIISSPAKRAAMTAQAVAEKCGYMNEIQWNEIFYLSSIEQTISELRGVSEDIKTVMIFGHNPTWEELTGKLSQKYISMNTASLAVLEYKLPLWKNLTFNSCNLELFLSPSDI